MGRWGLREIATLCMLVWVMAACGPALPATSLEPPAGSDATLILRTGLPPLTTPRAPGGATLPAATLPARSSERTSVPWATPHYYTVVRGDTLAGIAERFGVSVVALSRANGNLSPDILYPGRILLIPAEMSASDDGTFVRFLPTSTPLVINLPAPSCYRTPADELLCLGWIPNTTDAPLSGVSVQVALYAANGGRLDQRTAAAAQQIVPAGGGTPYVVRFQGVSAFAYARASLASAGQEDPGESALFALTTLEQQIEPEGALVILHGAARNEGLSPLRDMRLVVTLFDIGDHVTGFRVMQQGEALQPGEALPVVIPVTPLGAGTVRAVLHAEGLLLQPTETLAAISPAP